MFNRKCSRCREITGPVHGGKKVNEEFLCEDCLQKAKDAGEVPIEEETSYTAIKVLKVMNVIYLVVSIFSSLFVSSFLSMQSGSFEMSTTHVSSFGLGFVTFGSVFQSVLIFCVILVFIILVETVIKIYEKVK